MKQLDTDTVLTIIKMIDERQKQVISILETHKQAVAEGWNTYADPYVINYSEGQAKAYKELSRHLQSYIEGQLNAAENSTAE